MRSTILKLKVRGKELKKTAKKRYAIKLSVYETKKRKDNLKKRRKHD